ncbi:echinoidin-like [Diadema antillarum]|uniref:echinoidin-like n=1 Tax=Diadema antillarum TaxID=105358 RepID=UPI003A8917EF
MFSVFVRLYPVLFLGFALAALPSTQAGGCGCPPLWTAFQGHCYRYFSVENTTWYEAELHCRSFAVPCNERDGAPQLGHLVSIHSQEETDFIVSLYETVRNKRVSTKTRVWIGLHDKVTEDTFTWSDGSPLDYRNFAPGQPNSYQGEQDCISFCVDWEHTWNDLACEPNLEFTVEAFICKLPVW